MNIFDVVGLPQKLNHEVSIKIKFCWLHIFQIKLYRYDTHYAHDNYHYVSFPTHYSVADLGIPHFCACFFQNPELCFTGDRPTMNGRSMIQDWLNRTVKVQITDGRTLIGTTLEL